MKTYKFYAMDAARLFLRVAKKEITPGKVIDDYRERVNELAEIRTRFRNPINMRNGEPLKQG